MPSQNPIGVENTETVNMGTFPSNALTKLVSSLVGSSVKRRPLEIENIMGSRSGEHLDFYVL